jgi:tetraacyldisaccharide 4'-kinase
VLAALAVARALEDGTLRGPVARGLSRVWGRIAAGAIVRPLARPPGVALVAIGGATLGGSGKTPLAIACARELARAGARVALVGHAYRARPGRPRVVAQDDALDEVGDEALLATLELAGEGVAVVVGPSRASAVAYAASLAEVLVVDGVLQTNPRASLALLAVDELRPWGHAQAVPPCGDLRAPVAALVAAADRIVAVGEGSTDARTGSRGVRVADELRPWSELAGLRLGLVVALGRPARVVASLARHGLVPSVVVPAEDHGPVPLDALRRAPPVDLWIASSKCALRARPALEAVWPGRSIAVLEHTVALGPALTELLRSLAP